MGQRILDEFEHLPVKLGFGTVHFEFDFLAKLGRKIANDPRQFLPRIADRLHARLHHPFLEFGGDVRQPLQRHFEIGIFMPSRDLKELVAGQHQFRNRRHQAVERVDADPDRMIRNSVTGKPFGELGFLAAPVVATAPVVAGAFEEFLGAWLRLG